MSQHSSASAAPKTQRSALIRSIALPREFERTILRLLARRQEERYQSPTELLADLAAIAGAHGIAE